MAPTSTMVPTGVTLSDAKLFRQSCYVDGVWTNAASGGTVAVDNPATGEVIGTVPKLGAAETRLAIEAADRALPAWRKKTATERAAIVRRWYEVGRVKWGRRSTDRAAPPPAPPVPPPGGTA